MHSYDIFTLPVKSTFRLFKNVACISLTTLILCFSTFSHSAYFFISPDPTKSDADFTTGSYDVNISDGTYFRVIVTEEYAGEISSLETELDTIYLSWFVSDNTETVFDTSDISSITTAPGGATATIGPATISWIGGIDLTQTTTYNNTIFGGFAYELGGFFMNIPDAPVTIFTDALALYSSTGGADIVNITGPTTIINPVPLPAALPLFIAGFSILFLFKRKFNS